MPDPAPIDCDLHPTVPAMSALMPYLDDMWRETVLRRGIDELNTISYPSNSPLTARADWRDARGKPATTAERLGHEALDPFGTRIAILNCLYGVQATFSEDLGAAMARAVNDWITREWLDRDPRLRASIVVPQQNAELAVAEIERCAGDRRFVQVLLLVSGELPLGRRQNWPIYAAAERHGLTVGIHAGSSYRHPNTPVGWSSYYTEEYINQAGAFQTQLTSLITEGVFAKFPDLTVVLMESGVTWLPGYLWRLTKFWKGLRSEVPWVADPPATIVRDRVRLTLQPFDGPPEPETITRFMEHMGSDALLLFSTDYPHWQFEGTDAVPAGLDPRAGAEDHGGQPAADLCSATGDSDMNVDVLNRSGVQAPAQSKLAIADCDVHPRPPGAGIGGVSKALYPYLSQRWREHVETIGVRYRQPWERGSAYPKGQPQACRRDAWPNGDNPGSDLAFMAQQHLDPNNVAFAHPQPADQRPGRAGPRAVGGADPCHQRMAGGGVDLARCAAEGIRRGAVRGRPDRGRDDRGARRRSQFRPGDAADPHRRTPRPAALLADLSGGGRGEPADRHPRLRLWRQRDDLGRLAVVLHRGDGRPRPMPAGGADQPDLRGCVRALPDPEGGADRGRLRLGAGARLADGPAVRQAAPRSAASEAAALGIHADAMSGSPPSRSRNRSRASTWPMPSSGWAGTACCSPPTIRTGISTIPRTRCRSR